MAAKKTEVKEEKSGLLRVLSDVVLVSAAAFSRLGVSKQTETMTTLTKAGKPVEFVSDFNILTDRRYIREKLLSGKDIARELEFNGLDLSAEDAMAIKAITPLLARIDAMGPKYEWLPVGNATFTGIEFVGESIRRDGHSITCRTAKTFWDRASKYWSGGPKPSDGYHNVGGSYRDIYYSNAGVKIGCQSISRLEVEHIAKEMGWAPVVYEKGVK